MLPATGQPRSCRPAPAVLTELSDVEQRNRLHPADVEGFAVCLVRQRHGEERVNDVGHVGEIPQLRTVPEDFQVLPSRACRMKTVMKP